MLRQNLLSIADECEHCGKIVALKKLLRGWKAAGDKVRDARSGRGSVLSVLVGDRQCWWTFLAGCAECRQGWWVFLVAQGSHVVNSRITRPQQRPSWADSISHSFAVCRKGHGPG